MKHLRFADKTLFVDDATADALVEYAGLLAAEQSGDTITIRAIGQDGNEVEASLVLNMASNLITETTTGHAQPPLNDVSVAYMREKIDLLRNPRPAQPWEGDEVRGLEDGSVSDEGM